jgi:gliding motility-associated-like protein
LFAKSNSIGKNILKLGNREDIEKLVKSAFDNFEPEVNPDVWMNIQNGLNIGTATSSGPEGNNVSSGTKFTGVASKFSMMSIIGTIATALVITASVIYFSLDKQTVIDKQVNESKTIETGIPAASIETVSKEIIKDHNENETEEPASSIPGVKETATVKKSDYYSSTNDDIPVAVLDKKDATEIMNEKHKEADLKPQEASIQITPFGADETKSMENSGAEEASTSPEPEAELATTIPEEAEEKNTVECLEQIRNAFTPNGDGVNDVFIIECQELLNLDVTIIEQATGKIIHHWNNLHGFWDGKTENGQTAKKGMYIYNIFAQPKAGKPITKTGTLQLILN